ncbi:MAG: sugar kinase [Rhodospirillales bacterium]|nr:sugar kinase [Rhodospirillales bacterium]
MPPDLLCMGEPMLEFNQLPPGPDGRVLFLEGHGGDTSNAAIAAARQGARVGFLTALGEDPAGASFRALWAREGVDAGSVRADPAHQTGVYFVFHGPDGHSFLHYRANSAAANYGPEHLPAEALAACRILFLSGISLGISDRAADAAFAAIEAVRAAGGIVALDTNYRPRLWPPARARAVMEAAIREAAIVFPGEEDARVMLGTADPDAVLDHYLSLGPRVAVVKLGAGGAYLGTADGVRVRIAAHPVAVLDATGAGDAFCGAFLARHLAGDPPEAAARYANAAAALKCTGYGAVAPIPRPEAVRALLAESGRAGGIDRGEAVKL